MLRSIMVALIVVASGMITASAAEDSVPLPRPRPAEADVQAEPVPDGSRTAPVAAAPEPSDCRKALTEAIAIAPSIPPIRAGACGGDDLVRLEAVVLPDGQRVPLKPAATLRCEMASAVVDWIRSDIVPLTDGFGSALREIDNFDSYDCRGRNRVEGARMSEHGRANALDIRGFKLADGRAISLPDRDTARETREKILASVCARFSTVLGPSSDWYHEDHIHLDLAPRRNNYRICQWAVLDPLPKVAPLMPAARPAEASAPEADDEAPAEKQPSK